MAKKFYLVTSCDDYGQEIVGLFDNQEQAEAAATLEEIDVRYNDFYEELTCFYTTVKELKINTKDYKSILNDYKSILNDYQ